MSVQQVEKAKTKIEKQPADIAQVTLLIDSSGSMSVVYESAVKSIQMVLDDVQKNPGVLLAVRSFNNEMNTLKDFVDEQKPFDYNPCGKTHLYSSLEECVKLSQQEAALTPEMKVHHTFIIITDGHDTTSSTAAMARKMIAKLGASASWILLDFSPSGNAGAALGIEGIHMSLNERNLLETARKVCDTINQISTNVLTKQSPDANLALLPGK